MLESERALQDSFVLVYDLSHFFVLWFGAGSIEGFLIFESFITRRFFLVGFLRLTGCVPTGFPSVEFCQLIMFIFFFFWLQVSGFICGSIGI